MSKERPNPDKFANELAAGSAFFRKSASPPATEPEPSQPPTAEATPKPEPVRPVRVVKRQMIRHPFELYMDQLERLRALAEEQRRSGGVGSMSRMVREAIDRYLDEHAS
jgi:hypothetical protein